MSDLSAFAVPWGGPSAQPATPPRTAHNEGSNRALGDASTSSESSGYVLCDNVTNAPAARSNLRPLAAAFQPTAVSTGSGAAPQPAPPQQRRATGSTGGGFWAAPPRGLLFAGATSLLSGGLTAPHRLNATRDAASASEASAPAATTATTPRSAGQRAVAPGDLIFDGRLHQRQAMIRGALARSAGSARDDSSVRSESGDDFAAPPLSRPPAPLLFGPLQGAAPLLAPRPIRRTEHHMGPIGPARSSLSGLPATPPVTGAEFRVRTPSPASPTDRAELDRPLRAELDRLLS